MKERLQRRVLWVCAALCIACGSAWSLVPLDTAAQRLTHVPLQVGEFAGVDVPLNEREQKVLGRVDHVHREYVFGNATVYVTLIDGSRDRHAVHDPRYCFRGAGWTVVDEERRPLPGGEATWWRARREGEFAEAAFWFSDGTQRHSSLPAYLWNSVVRRVSFGQFGTKPVLVVVQSFSADPMDWARISEMTAALQL